MTCARSAQPRVTAATPSQHPRPFLLPRNPTSHLHLHRQNYLVGFDYDFDVSFEYEHAALLIVTSRRALALSTDAEIAAVGNIYNFPVIYPNYINREIHILHPKISYLPLIK